MVMQMMIDGDGDNGDGDGDCDGENLRFTSPAVESLRPGILVNLEKSTPK